MWCPDCQEEFVAVAGAEVQVCPRCSAAAKAGVRRRRIPKLEPGEKPTLRIRVDSAHDKKLTRVRTAPGQPVRRSNSMVETMLGVKSLTHLVVFGLFVYLLGQAILVWSFLVGHYTAWSIANLVSVVGVSLAFVGVAMTLRHFELRISQLAKLVGRPAGKNRRRSRKVAGKPS